MTDAEALGVNEEEGEWDGEDDNDADCDGELELESSSAIPTENVGDGVFDGVIESDGIPFEQ